ncbi:LOW QUALITY PROTEIN: FK506-binding protein 5-like [Bombus pascuorum]|uniref:LOW QUALITY PROTEIN: FK506-binding protein 5-like n=1 Tax=Bombus pascuorum TaxID=65598 RepID=UPI00298E8157|nr:LOW QUALITY PROTEIN: FK506-binding protein 5-like [Bombus pascuorum]
MNLVLQTHGAKHIYKVPEGLRELCTDISREVLRSQPANLIAFIADYVDTLLITRENTKVAVKVVNNILLESQAILCILYRTGFTLEQIAVAAPRIQVNFIVVLTACRWLRDISSPFFLFFSPSLSAIFLLVSRSFLFFFISQKAFREYLDEVDTQPVQACEDPTCDEKSMISIRDILEATGAAREDAERAATVIQAAFRGHYERMVLSEAEGKIQWQRAVTNTLDILRKAGATQAEISKAARLVKVIFLSLTRHYLLMFAAGTEEAPLKKDERILEPVEAVQAVAWMEMMYQDSGLTLEKANEAAAIIQRAYKEYRARRRCYDVQQLVTTQTMVAEAIVDTVHRKIFEKVTSRPDIPTEYGTREEMMATSTQLQLTFKEHMKMSRLIKESDLKPGEYEEDEEEYKKQKKVEEVVPTEPAPKPKYRPVEPRVPPSRTEYREEPLTEEEETEELQATETEITEPLTVSPDLQTEPETERSELVDEIEEDEVRETKEDIVKEKEEEEEKEAEKEEEEEEKKPEKEEEGEEKEAEKEEEEDEKDEKLKEKETEEKEEE